MGEKFKDERAGVVWDDDDFNLDSHGVEAPEEDVFELFAEQETDLLIVACDLAHLSSTDLGALIDAARQRPDADVVVANGGRQEPACALWRSTAADRIRTSFEAGERAVHRVLPDLCTVEVSLPPQSLRNINTPGDLDRYS
jgi:molybdopterin-guanine dinucleotide biosynthesis protein A